MKIRKMIAAWYLRSIDYIGELSSEQFGLIVIILVISMLSGMANFICCGENSLAYLKGFLFMPFFGLITFVVVKGIKFFNRKANDWIEK